MTSHLDDGTIHELIDGEIASTDLPPIQAHLAQCAECRDRLQSAQATVAEVDSFIEALDEVGPVTASHALDFVPPKRSRLVGTLAWAASLVLAAGLGYYMRPALTPLARTPSDAVEQPLQPSTNTAPGMSASDASRDVARGTSAPEVGVSAEAPVERRRDAGNAPAQPTVATPESARSLADQVRGAAGQRAEALGTASGATALAAPPGATAAPAAAPRALPGEGKSIEVPDRVMRQAQNALVPRDQVTVKEVPEAAKVDTVTFVDAVRRLGGRLLLIEGLVPVRLEAVGREVRVIYPNVEGELVLRQSFVNGNPQVALIAPPGFPADSLAALRRRVQE